MSAEKLFQKILASKGVSEEQIAALTECGVNAKDDFATIGDAKTLMDVAGLEEAVAEELMAWALGQSAAVAPTAAASQPANITIDSADIVYCSHCQTKQPKDYKSGDLCLNCGKQAEPSNTCYWCSSLGPGKFCRACGSEFVPVGEFELAALLKRDGNSKDEIAGKLKAMDQDEKDRLWERARRPR